MSINKTKQMSEEDKKTFVKAAEMQKRAMQQKQAIFDEAAFLKALWELNHYRRQLGMEAQHLAEKIKNAVDDVLEELGPFNDAQKAKAYERVGLVATEDEDVPEEGGKMVSDTPKIEIVRD